MSRTMRWDIKEVAYHEAGHFVIRAKLLPDSYGGEVSIDCNRRPGSAGFVDDHGPGYDPAIKPDPHGDGWVPDREAIKNMMVGCYAGLAAQLRYGSRSPKLARKVGAGTDYRKARELAIPLLTLSPRKFRSIQYRLSRRAERLVKKHWPTIDRLAEELLKRKTISGEEARIIMDAAEGEITEAELTQYRQIIEEQHARSRGVPSGSEHLATSEGG